MLQPTLAPVNSSVNSPAFLAGLEDLMLDGLDSPKEDDLRAGSRYEHPAVSHTESEQINGGDRQRSLGDGGRGDRARLVAASSVSG